jgi:hypothetical protein
VVPASRVMHCAISRLGQRSRALRGNGKGGAQGLLLMLGYLGADGFTSTFQDKLFRGYQMSAFNQMLYVNAFSSLISAAGARPARAGATESDDPEAHCSG